MVKAYLYEIMKSTTRPGTADYTFGRDPNWAPDLPEERAQDLCVSLDHSDVKILSATGETHICVGFKFEERKPNEFVVYYDSPFFPTALRV